MEIRLTFQMIHLILHYIMCIPDMNQSNYLALKYLWTHNPEIFSQLPAGVQIEFIFFQPTITHEENN